MPLKEAKFTENTILHIVGCDLHRAIHTKVRNDIFYLLKQTKTKDTMEYRQAVVQRGLGKILSHYVHVCRDIKDSSNSGQRQNL